MIASVHFGVVVANSDPKRQGRLKIRVDDVEEGLPLGDEWIPPTFPFAGKDRGFFFVPNVGAQVEVELQSDDDAAVDDVAARWRGVLYSDVDPVPSEFTSSYGSRGGLKVGGEVLLFDEAQGVTAVVSSNVRLGEESASHPVVRGDTLNSALDAFLTSMAAASSFGQINTAATTLKGLLSTWLSSKVKTE